MGQVVPSVGQRLYDDAARATESRRGVAGARGGVTTGFAVALLLLLLQAPCEAEQLAAPRVAGLLDREQLEALDARGLHAADVETPTSFSGLLAAVGRKMTGLERQRRAPGDMMGGAKDMMEKAKSQMKQVMEKSKGMGGKQAKDMMNKATNLMKGSLDKATKGMGKGGKQMTEAINKAKKQMKNIEEKMPFGK